MRTWIGCSRPPADVPRVFWVNLRWFTGWVPAANQELVDATHRYPNLRIVDWSALATPMPNLEYDDGLHLNPYGQAAMADLLARVLHAYRVVRQIPTTRGKPITPRRATSR